MKDMFKHMLKVGDKVAYKTKEDQFTGIITGTHHNHYCIKTKDTDWQIHYQDENLKKL